MSNARFSNTQARAAKDKELPDPAFRTLAVLGCYANLDSGWCFPGYKTLSEDLGKTIRNVRKDIQKLKEMGYLESRPRFRKDGSQTSNDYRLVFDLPDTTTTGETVEERPDPRSQRDRGGRSKSDRALTNQVNEPENEPGKKTTSYATNGKKFPDSPPSIYTFPTRGKESTWTLSQSALLEYEANYPGVDVAQELRSARQWCIDNPAKRKTAGRGIKAFLTRWLNNACNRPGRFGASTTSNHNQEVMKKVLGET